MGNSAIKTAVSQNPYLAIGSEVDVNVIPVASIIDMADKKNYIPSDGHPAAIANQTIANWMAKNIIQNK